MKYAYVRIYNIKRLNTEFEDVFESRIAVYDQWHDSFVDSYLDDQIYYWYSKEEFEALKIGQRMDDDTIYLIEIDPQYHVEQITLHEDEEVLA